MSAQPRLLKCQPPQPAPLSPVLEVPQAMQTPKLSSQFVSPYLLSSIHFLPAILLLESDSHSKHLSLSPPLPILLDWSHPVLLFYAVPISLTNSPFLCCQSGHCAGSGLFSPGIHSPLLLTHPSHCWRRFPTQICLSRSPFKHVKIVSLQDKFPTSTLSPADFLSPLHEPRASQVSWSHCSFFPSWLNILLCWKHPSLPCRIDQFLLIEGSTLV